MGNHFTTSRIRPRINNRARQNTTNRRAQHVRGQFGPLIPPVYNPPWEFKEECVVCMDKKINTVIIPCGHCVMCFSCTAELCSTKLNCVDGILQYPKCPMCRVNIESISLLYPKIIPVEHFAFE